MAATLLVLVLVLGVPAGSQTRLRHSQVRDWVPRAGTYLRLNQLRRDKWSKANILDRCGDPLVTGAIPWSMWVITDLSGPAGQDWAPGGCPDTGSPPCRGTYLPLRMVWLRAFDPPAGCQVARGEW